MPVWTVKVAAAANQTWGKITNTSRMLALDKVHELDQRHWVCSSEGARRDLNWSPHVQWPEGVHLTADWYREHEWL